MAWPYEFLELTREERQARRLVLDRYGGYGATLVLLPAAVALVVRLVAWAVAKARERLGGHTGRGDGAGAYNVIPDSPSLKSSRLTTRGSLRIWVRQIQWWLSDDVVIFGQTYGQRDMWVAGSAWTALLLPLCFLETGRDYLHLTKRLGIVAASQFPVQYVLALKCANPFVHIFRSSSEQLNRWHRVLGVIVYTLLLLHTALYLNFFVKKGDLLHRLFRPVIAIGIVSIFGMTLLTTTTLAVVRRFSYRVFFITHVVVSFSLPPLIMYHAHHANRYTAPALLFLIADITLRKIYTITAQASVEAIPGTDLVKVSTPIPQAKMDRFLKHPGSHIYMGLPAVSRPSSSPLSYAYLLFEFMFNPFTIASVNEDTSELTLVVRTQKGPMTTLLARNSYRGSLPTVPGGGGGVEEEEVDDEDDNEDTPAIRAFQAQQEQEISKLTGQVHINIEGPYGTTSYFPALSLDNFDRVLLVAGGVGATFVVPIYRHIVHNNPGVRVDFVWSIRGAGEATWAVVSGQDGSGRNILADNNVHIFMTGDGPASNGRTSAAPVAEAEIELGALRRGNQYHSRFAVGGSGGGNRQRPDLRYVVDDVFRQGGEERVAVVVCGPEAMVQDLRAAVGVWVKKGRTIWWHNESFGW